MSNRAPALALALGLVAGATLTGTYSRWSDDSSYTYAPVTTTIGRSELNFTRDGTESPTVPLGTLADAQAIADGAGQGDGTAVPLVAAITAELTSTGSATSGYPGLQGAIDQWLSAGGASDVFAAATITATPVAAIEDCTTTPTPDPEPATSVTAGTVTQVWCVVAALEDDLSGTMTHTVTASGTATDDAGNTAPVSAWEDFEIEVFTPYTPAARPVGVAPDVTVTYTDGSTRG